MPFGVKSAGFNPTTLKKLRKLLGGREVYSSDTLSNMLDIELRAVESHMLFYGYKTSGEPMSKEDHKEHVDGLNITKRQGLARKMEQDLHDAEFASAQINTDNARESAAKAELAEIQLAEAKTAPKSRSAAKG